MTKYWNCAIKYWNYLCKRASPLAAKQAATHSILYSEISVISADMQIENQKTALCLIYLGL